MCTVLELEQCSYQKKDFILCGWSLSTIATASSKVVAATLASILIPPNEVLVLSYVLERPVDLRELAICLAVCRRGKKLHQRDCS